MIRNEIHTRSDFASKQFIYWSNKLAAWQKICGSIQGNTPQGILKKLNQCNRIWFHYADEFKLNSPKPQTPFASNP